MGAKTSETNVRIPESAWKALEAIKIERGLSRDAIVRLLLAEHIAEQQQLEAADRLTHISTVLRHPAPPKHRNAPKTGRRLRMRLEPGTAEQARALSLRLPGQPERRGHRDYQPRQLTDAVVTAIARQREFTDEVLDGLKPLIRHRAATGLWHLTAAATTTRSEAEIYAAAEPPIRAGSATSGDPAARRRTELIADVLREDVAWHDRWRQVMVAHLAGKLLRGPGADDAEQMLYEQRTRWGILRHDLENRTGFDHWLLEDIDLSATYHDLEGRGGTAVWRATRVVELQELDYWIMGKPGNIEAVNKNVPHVAPSERVMEPPGWILDMPDGWHSLVSQARPPPLREPWASHVAAGRILHVEAQNRRVLWPVVSSHIDGAMRPVPGFDVVLNAVKHHPVHLIVESVLLRLDVHDDEHSEFLRGVRVPAGTAHELGLIDRDTRDEIVSKLRVATRREMLAAIDALPADSDHDFARDKLRNAMHAPRLFAKIADSWDVPFTAREPDWIWPVRSVADEVERGTRPDAVAWLATWAVKTVGLGLERSMQKAWHTAFERFRPEGVTGYVTSTVKSAQSSSPTLVPEPDSELEPPF